jgi:hypothetical protein
MLNKKDHQTRPDKIFVGDWGNPSGCSISFNFNDNCNDAYYNPKLNVKNTN